MSLNLLAAVAVGALAAPASECAELSGAHLVLNDASKPFIIVGERHGTAEIPMLFANLVCLAASKGPIVVGLEIESDQQSSLDTYLASDGGTAAPQCTFERTALGVFGRAGQPSYVPVAGLS